MPPPSLGVFKTLSVLQFCQGRKNRKIFHNNQASAKNPCYRPDPTGQASQFITIAIITDSLRAHTVSGRNSYGKMNRRTKGSWPSRYEAVKLNGLRENQCGTSLFSKGRNFAARWMGRQNCVCRYFLISIEDNKSILHLKMSFIGVVEDLYLQRRQTSIHDFMNICIYIFF